MFHGESLSTCRQFRVDARNSSLGFMGSVEVFSEIRTKIRGQGGGCPKRFMHQCQRKKTFCVVDLEDNLAFDWEHRGILEKKRPFRARDVKKSVSQRAFSGPWWPLRPGFGWSSDQPRGQCSGAPPRSPCTPSSAYSPPIGPRTPTIPPRCCIHTASRESTRQRRHKWRRNLR